VGRNQTNTQLFRGYR